MPCTATILQAHNSVGQKLGPTTAKWFILVLCDVWCGWKVQLCSYSCTTSQGGLKSWDLSKGMDTFYYYGCSSVCWRNPASVLRWWIKSRRQFWVKSTERALLFCQQKGSQLTTLKTVCPALEPVVSSLIVFKEQGVISLWMFFWLTGGEVMGSQHHQPSGSNRPGVRMLVGNVQCTSPPGGSLNICKAVQRPGLRILSIALKEELKVLDFFND